MKYNRRTPEQIEEKCNLLMSLGFEILHNDSCVRMNGAEFDLSATGMDVRDIFYATVAQAFNMGKEAGVEKVQKEIRSVLGFIAKEED